MPPVTKNLAVAMMVHDDVDFLELALGSFRIAGTRFLFVSTTAWDGTSGSWKRAVKLGEAAGAEVITGDWASEDEQRRAVLTFLRERGFTHALLPDTDEIIEQRLLDTLVEVAKADLADRVYVEWDTYWKSPEYVIRPREPFTPLMMVNLNRVEHQSLRNYSGGRHLLVNASYGVVHHLSYAGSDDRIRRKVRTWSHRDEVVDGWWEQVWKGWDDDKLIRHLHPTHPPAYGFAERISVPDELSPIAKSAGVKASPTGKPVEVPLSVILPVHGQFDLLANCLGSIARSESLPHEVILIDDGSPETLGPPTSFPIGVEVIRNEQPLGYAAACNLGASKATGKYLLFLNSDTVLPSNALSELMRSLQASGAIAGAGPFSNAVGHFQLVHPTYTDLARLDLFALDFASRDLADEDTDMLVGFCLAVRQDAFAEVGGFDERFGRGTFEDNDLCYRLRRAGYRLVISQRSFVHHEGNKSFHGASIDMGSLMVRNARLFQEKWKEDLRSGFSSHLSGLAAGRIVFAEQNRPERKLAQLREQTKQARISLCMIVRDEERVLGDCLTSATPYFDEVIVVDTGSTDRTRDIAKNHRAKVLDFPWTDSFSEARNESLRHATGNWIFWLDADDTLPPETGEAIRRSAADAPDDIHGFVIPVQFVDEGPGAGTRVDHVKLFRNLPGLRFEGRIHEQILPSLNLHKGQVARLDAIVLHSGYDTSPEGQAKKRVRDERLLKLDLAERPNHPFALFNLGMTCHFTDGHEEAIEWLDKCLSVSKDHESHVRKAYAMKALSLKQLGRTDEALSTLEEGVAKVGNDPELLFRKGLILSEREQYEEARAAYEAMETDIAAHFSSVDVGILGHKRFHNLGTVCFAAGDYMAARTAWMSSLQAAPSHLLSAFALFDAALSQNDPDTCKEMLEHVRTIEGPSENWASMAQRFGATQSSDGGLMLLRRCVADFPHEIGPQLVLMRQLLERNCELEARQIATRLSGRGIAEASFVLGVMDSRKGKFVAALGHMERAHVQNPHHEETLSQIEALQLAMKERSSAESTPQD